VPPAAQLINSILTRLVQAPAAALVRLDDDAAAVWEPFLRDDQLSMVHGSV
jgi:hypothetical protein